MLEIQSEQQFIINKIKPYKLVNLSYFLTVYSI